MLNLTRACGTLDVGRLANAVSRPGIDPRNWFSFAAVTAIGMDTEGLFANVLLLPTGSSYTARVAGPYAGPNFGWNFPLDVNDEVVVAAPDGDPLHGLVVVARLNSASDPMPQDALDNPNDIVLVVKPDQSFRVNVSGTGQAYLGSTNATDAAVLGTTYRSAEDNYFAALETLIASIVAFPALAAYFAIPASPQLAALAAWNLEVTAFHLAAAEYLSQKVNIG